MPSSDPTVDSPLGPPGAPDDFSPAKTLMGVVVVLLVGALAMFAVGRAAPSSRDLPLLPPFGGVGGMGLDALSIAAAAPPTSIGPGVVAPAGDAPAYRLNAGTTPEIVTALTVALGLTAGSESRSDDRGYLVVDRGSDRVLQVRKAAGHPWTLGRGDPDCFDRRDATVSSDGRVICPDSGFGGSQPGQVGGSEPSTGSGVSGSSQGQEGEQLRCAPVDCPDGMACAQVCPDPVPVPTPSDLPPVELDSPQAAESRTREVLNAMGLEVARTTLSAAPDGSAWQVLAEISIGGIAAVGMDTHLSIGEGNEVVAGSGMVPDVTLLGRYPLIGASETLSRLQQMHSGEGRGFGGGREPALGAPEPDIAPFAPHPPGPPTVVTGLRLVLLLQTGNVEERAGDYLVPAFLVDASDGAVFTVPAATDDHLAEPPDRPFPEPVPLPAPVDRGAPTEPNPGG